MAEYTGLIRTVAPAIEPVSLDEIKAHLRVEHADDDALLLSQIAAARGYAEAITGAALITQTYQANYAQFGSHLLLPKTPIQSVTSVKYLDTAGDQQTLSSDEYRLTQDTTGWIIMLNPDYSWPAVYAVRDAIEVVFVAGYGSTAASVPEEVRQAIKLLCGHYYENREGVSNFGQPVELPLGIKSMLFTGCRNWGQ